ncbi:hypothetical protein L873DRAFT_1806414 [Choiromyces venosus 120613-1]|uniref:Uncharacterized protein n=1 Tax=Choiromyces venosus 120613-1 TaxID=1336337 RepID=A0A3N4JN12_9PEZI|nr:hypothetical protein L873DRAFT_1806414 [Choiromyces venosus 120613-1]
MFMGLLINTGIGIGVIMCPHLVYSTVLVLGVFKVKKGDKGKIPDTQLCISVD